MCPKCEPKSSSKYLVLSLVLVFNVFSLNSFASSSQHKGHSMGHKEKMKQSDRKAIDETTKSQLIAVFQQNEKLHKAFFDGKNDEISSDAKSLEIKIGEISNPEISKLLKFSRKKLNEISNSKDKEANKQNYHLVSMALIHVLNQYDLGNDYNAYSCPMVKKKWIQNSKTMAKVHNPYAPKMPHCGSQDSSY